MDPSQLEQPESSENAASVYYRLQLKGTAGAQSNSLYHLTTTVLQILSRPMCHHSRNITMETREIQPRHACSLYRGWPEEEAGLEGASPETGVERGSNPVSVRSPDTIQVLSCWLIDICTM